MVKNLKIKVMNYDDWKLASPPEGGLVSSCCGEDYNEEYESDLEFDYYVCVSCQDECDIIEDYEYEQNRRESYLEDLADEQRLER